MLDPVNQISVARPDDVRRISGDIRRLIRIIDQIVEFNRLEGITEVVVGADHQVCPGADGTLDSIEPAVPDEVIPIQATVILQIGLERGTVPVCWDRYIEKIAQRRGKVDVIEERVGMPARNGDTGPPDYQGDMVDALISTDVVRVDAVLAEGIAVIT